MKTFSFKFLLLSIFSLVAVAFTAGCGAGASNSSVNNGFCTSIGLVDSIIGGCGPSSVASTTVLTYVIGSDLQCSGGFATQNIREMQNVSSTSDTNVVVLTGGVGLYNCTQDQYKSNSPGYTSMQARVETVINGTKDEQIFPAPLGLANANMGDPNTLQGFIQWGVKNYPAKKYILVLWDHGGGVNGGVGPDTTQLDSKGNPLPSATMTTPQIIQAVSGAIASTGINKFEIIGFDTCLTGMAEVAAGLSPYSKYMVASEETEPGGGWDYTAFLNYVNNNLTASGKDIGIKIVDSFISKCAANAPNMSATLSVIDLSQMSSLLASINDFASKLLSYATASLQNWQNVAWARFGSLDFTTYALPLYSDTFDYVDLIQFIGNIENIKNIDQALRNSAANLIKVAQNAIVYKNNSNIAPVNGALGLSIYFPSIMPSFNTSYTTNTLLANKVSFFADKYSGAGGLVNGYNKYYQDNNLSLESNISRNDNGSVTTWTIQNGGNIIAAPTLFLGDFNGTHISYYTSQIAKFSNNAFGYDNNGSQNKTWATINGIPVIMFESLAKVSPLLAAPPSDYLIPVSNGYGGIAYLTVKLGSDNVLHVTGYLSSLTSKVAPLDKAYSFTLLKIIRDTQGYLSYAPANTIKIDSSAIVTTDGSFPAYIYWMQNSIDLAGNSIFN